MAFELFCTVGLTLPPPLAGDQFSDERYLKNDAGLFILSTTTNGLGGFVWLIGIVKSILTPLRWRTSVAGNAMDGNNFITRWQTDAVAASIQG